MKQISVLLILALLMGIFSGCLPLILPPQPATAEPAQNVPASTGSDSVPAWDGGVHPMLFHVTGANGQEGYLFGTIHVGDERSKEALKKLSPYLDSCDALAVEFDLVAYEQDRAAQIKMLTKFVLRDGTTVDQHISKDLFDRASALLSEAKLNPKLMKSYGLAMWSTLVEQAALLTRSDYDPELGMDRALIRHCYDKQIEVRDVESAELQYDLLTGFSDELFLLLIENTLDNLDEYGQNIDKLYKAWLAGSYEGLMAVLEEDTGDGEDLTEEEQTLLEDYNDKMLTQRNLGMRDKAVEWLKAGDKVFFAVGAAHLLDEDGLAALLRAAGYTVEQVDYK